MSRTQRVVQFLGIPYAQPPVNQLRFAAPVTDPLPTWSGIRNASNFGPSCPQAMGRRKLHERLYLRLLPNDQSDPGRSKDCLFLNIYVPDGEYFFFLLHFKIILTVVINFVINLISLSFNYLYIQKSRRYIQEI